MRKLSYIPLLILLFCSAISTASTTVVKGSADQFKGKELELFTYSDYVSLKKEMIGYNTIATNGTFQLQFNSDEVKKIYLKIEDKTTSFFVQPGKVYNINLTYSEEWNKGRIYDKQLSLNFSFPVPTELNQEIGKFNRKFDDFILKNKMLFQKRDYSVEPKLKEFHLEMLKEFENTTNFMTSYINYSIAATQEALDVSYQKKDLKSTNIKEELYLTYLYQQPILYHHPLYIDFFRTFFKNEFKTLSLKVEGFDISKAINDKASYTALMEALGKFPFLQHEEFKSLFMLNGLLEVSSGKYFKKQNIVSILKEVQLQSKYPQQRLIAANMISLITQKKFGVGSVAPNFELKNKENETVALSSFKGKPIYINFWTSWSIPSLKEMKLMQVLYKKYKGQVEFISICADNDFDKMTQFLSKNEDYQWTFLHVGKDKKVVSNYQIVTYPTYVLIDANLKVVKYPAGRPGGTLERATEANIEKDIYELIHQ